MAYGGSQARGRIGAVAAGLRQSHAMWDLSHVRDLHHSPWQRRILNPLSEARDRTCNLFLMIFERKEKKFGIAEKVFHRRQLI